MKIHTLALLTILSTVISCSKKTPDSHHDLIRSAFLKIPDTAKWNAQWSEANVLVFHTIAEPNTLHPTNGNSQPRYEINLYTQCPLITIDIQTGNLKPILLKKLPENTTFSNTQKFELIQGIEWDDGSPLKSEDIAFTIKANLNLLTDNPFGKSYFDNVDSIIIEDDFKFKIVFKNQHLSNESMLADVPILQEKLYDENYLLRAISIQSLRDPNYINPQLEEWSKNFNNDKYGREPQLLNGLGQYKLKEWLTGESIMLVKKQSHWSRKKIIENTSMGPDTIIFKLNKDEQSTQLEFKKQIFDVSTNISMKALIALNESPSFSTNYYAIPSLSYNYTYLAMNNKPDGIKRKKIFSSIKTRKAIAYATPVEQIMQLIYGAYAKNSTRMVSMVSPLKPYVNRELSPIPFDLKAADSLLLEDGWLNDKNGRYKIINGVATPFKFDLHYLNTNQDWKDMALLIAEKYNLLGITVNLIPLDLKLFIDKARGHDYDMMLGSWGGTSTFEDYTQLWHTSSWENNGSNYSGFGNEESDSLINTMRTTLDTALRNKACLALQTKIYDEQPIVFLYCTLRRNIVHKRWKNIEIFAERPGLMLDNLILKK